MKKIDKGVCDFCGTEYSETNVGHLYINDKGYCICEYCVRFAHKTIDKIKKDDSTIDYEEFVCDICGNHKDDTLGLRGINEKYICEDCVDDIMTSTDSTRKECNVEYSVEHIKLTPRKIKEHLDNYVIGQEQAKKILSVAVYNHYNRIQHQVADVEIQKSNILLLGATGSGKTLLVRTLAKLLDVPFVEVDATSLTSAGYAGNDVESCLTRLIQVADNDIKKAEKGIVYIDEIDKIANKGGVRAGSQDVNGEGVQQGLLKLLDGTKAAIEMGRGTMRKREVEIDTKNILFICSGAFDGLKEIKQEKSKAIGFNRIEEEEKKEGNFGVEDITRYGMLPELVGRLPIVVRLDELKLEDYIRIIKEPKDSILKQYQAMLGIDKIDLKFDEDAIEEIAKVSFERKIGARGIRSTMDNVMLEIMYDVDRLGNEVRVTKEMVRESRL